MSFAIAIVNQLEHAYGTTRCQFLPPLTNLISSIEILAVRKKILLPPMEAAVAASAVTGAIKTLLPKLASLLQRKHKLSRGVRRQITSLRHEMSSMSALLVRLAALEELNAQQKDWRNKVRELSYDVEDCIDIFTNELDSDEAKRGGPRRRLKKLKARYKIAHRIEELRAQVVELSNCQDRYRLDECTSSRGLVDIDPRLQALYVNPDRLVGIHAQKENLIELLMKDADKQQLEVLAIVGAGGMGKTTLANQVYTKIKGQFDFTAFVSVSRSPDMAKVLSDIILEIFGHEPSPRDDKCHLINRIRNSLQDRRYAQPSNLVTAKVVRIGG
jgi:transcriptional regulator with AAA-type ATPase domain